MTKNLRWSLCSPFIHLSLGARCLWQIGQICKAFVISFCTNFTRSGHFHFIPFNWRRISSSGNEPGWTVVGVSVPRVCTNHTRPSHIESDHTKVTPDLVTEGSGQTQDITLDLVTLFLPLGVERLHVYEDREAAILLQGRREIREGTTDNREHSPGTESSNWEQILYKILPDFVQKLVSQSIGNIRLEKKSSKNLVQILPDSARKLVTQSKNIRSKWNWHLERRLLGKMRVLVSSQEKKSKMK